MLHLIITVDEVCWSYQEKIGKRTIRHDLPLSSPALVKRQVVGVFDKNLFKIFADALKNYIKFAWIINWWGWIGWNFAFARTKVIQLKNNNICEIIDPKALKINADKFENIIGDNAKYNADKIINIFKGEDNDFSKAVCLNAAAGLVVSEKFDNFEIAYNFSRNHIKSGAVNKYLIDYKMPENILEKILNVKKLKL